MTLGYSVVAALVSAASVTQLFQFGGKVFWGKEFLEGEVQLNVGARVETPLAGAGEVLRSASDEPTHTSCQPCDCPDVEHSESFLSDPWECTALAGASSLALVVGALSRQCCRRAPAPVAQHGRGAVLRDARIAQRQRLPALAAGQLGVAMV